MEAREVLPGIDDSITVTATREQWQDVLIDLQYVDADVDMDAATGLEPHSKTLRSLLEGLGLK